MFDRHSIQLKLAGITFLLLVFTVCSLIALTNAQMETAFGDYISLHLSVMEHGPAETMFIHSVHQSLWWVGLFFILLGSSSPPSSPQTSRGRCADSRGQPPL